MYKVNLAIACLAAASSALQLTQSDDTDNTLAAGVYQVEITGNLTVLEDQETTTPEEPVPQPIIPEVQTPPARNDSYPGDNCCRFWPWQGESVELCHNGEDSLEADLKDHAFDNNTYSFMCGNSVAYDMCINVGCGHAMDNHGAGSTMKRSKYQYMNGGLTFVRMWPYDAAMQGAATFFQPTGCHGHSGMVWSSEDPEGVERYDADALIVQEIKANAASSLMIPFGYSVKLYESGDLTGEPYTIDGPMYATSDYSMQCISLVDKFEDKVNSVEIYRTGVL